jgi:hypothetical protein
MDITDDEWSRYLLTSMKRHSKELKIEITAAKMMDKYRRWKERTSTSPSGRHLGHFHALFRPLKAKDNDDRDRLEGIRTDIIEMHAKMLQTAYDIQKMGIYTYMHARQRHWNTKDTQVTSDTLI